jgi:hypothetical protein
MLRHIALVGLVITTCTSFVPTKVSAATLTVTPVGELIKKPGEEIEFNFVFTPHTRVRVTATWFTYDSTELFLLEESPIRLVPFITSEPITIFQRFSVLTPLKNGQSDATGQIYYYELDEFDNLIDFGASNVALGADIVPIPQQPVPEPLTMLGAAAALGYGAILKRKYSKNTEF